MSSFSKWPNIIRKYLVFVLILCNYYNDKLNSISIFLSSCYEELVRMLKHVNFYQQLG